MTTRSFFISHTADGIRHILRVDPLRVGGDEVVWSHSTSLRIVDRAAQRYATLVATPEGAVLVAEAEQLTDFTPQDLQAAFGRVDEIAFPAPPADDIAHVTEVRGTRPEARQ